VIIVGAACVNAAPTEYWAVLPDGRTAQVEALAPEWARSRTWLVSTPTVVCSGPGVCRDVIGMRACPAPGTTVCFDADETKCVRCIGEKVVLRLGAERAH
jgi:hypothetical protein